MGIDELANKLTILASKATLSKAEHAEAVRLMRQLKKAGMTNGEISELSNGKWSESTVKGYTKAVKSDGASPWQDAVSLLHDLISTGLSLDEVEMALSVHDDLEAHGVSLNEVANLLIAAESASIDLASLVKHHQECKELGLAPAELAEVLAPGKELHEMGLALDSFKPIVELAKKHGDPEYILQAVSNYQSLTELSKQIDMSKAELEKLNQQVDKTHEHIEEAKAKLTQLEKPHLLGGERNAKL